MEQYAEFTERISDLLKQLDQTRVDLCSLATEMSEYQSAYDKNDQTYLHRLENIDANNIMETQKLVKEWQDARNGRRSVKDLLGLVSNTIEQIPYKNYTNALPILKGSSYVQKWQ